MMEMNNQYQESQNSDLASAEGSQEAEEVQPSNQFESVKLRLQEIADAVSDENISLDDALDLYEEAVSLGLQASDLLEVGIVVEEEDIEASASDDTSIAETQDEVVSVNESDESVRADA